LNTKFDFYTAHMQAEGAASPWCDAGMCSFLRNICAKSAVADSSIGIACANFQAIDGDARAIVRPSIVPSVSQSQFL
jgi:hypothetical protein